MLRRWGFFDDIFRRMLDPWEKEFPWISERDPFEAFDRLIEEQFESFRKRVPSEFIWEREIPGGKVTTVGPIYYGWSYKKEPGKPPEIREFGNVRPTLGGRRLELAEAGEREPIEAEYKDGLLKVILQKRGEKVRRIFEKMR